MSIYGNFCLGREGWRERVTSLIITIDQEEQRATKSLDVNRSFENIKRPFKGLLYHLVHVCLCAIFIILRNSSSRANGQTVFWLPTFKLSTPTTDDKIN